jgi:hypothetical protein
VSKKPDQNQLLVMPFKFMWPETSTENVKQSVIDQLAELQAVRSGNLTDEEYAGWRRTILNGIADNDHPEPAYIATAGIMGIVFAAGLAYALSRGRTDWVVGTGCGLVAAVVTGLQCWRGLAAKRRLSNEDRLTVIAALLDRGLVSTDEADTLRERVRELDRSGQR